MPRALIVDDKEENLYYLAALLSGHGYQTDCAQNGAEALDKARESLPDVIISDLLMPVMDGFTLLYQWKTDEKLKVVPFVVYTATYTRPEDEQFARSLGADAFILKPLEPEDFMARLGDVLARTDESSAVQPDRSTSDEKTVLKLYNGTIIRKLEERSMQLEMANRALEQDISGRKRAEETLRLSELETIECLARAGEYRDDDTGQHTHRVGNTAALLASTLGINETDANIIRRAAPLHDVGKIGIPDSILLKPGKLTTREFDIMKAHTTIGYEILSRHHTTMLQMAARIALTHHERWDGAGYPNGLAGDSIGIHGLLVAVADVFDALTHSRPYKEAWPIDSAVAEIKSQSARQFAPDVVEAFLTLSHDQLI